MIRYIVRHINLMLFTLFALSVASFALAYLFPADPLVNLSGVQRLSEEEFNLLSEKYAMNESIIIQYLQYMSLLFQGDWGISFSSGLPLGDEIKRSLPASIELSAYSLVISMLVGVPLGFFAGLRHNKHTDYVLLGVSVAGYSVPVFWLALLLIMLFALQLPLFPLSGRISLLFDIPYSTGFILPDIWLSDINNKTAATINAIEHMILPTLAISVVNTAIVLRLTRSAVLDVMGSDFVQAAYSRGLTVSQVIFRHGIRNVLLRILPLLALQTSTLLTNAMIVEVIFSWPGIGNWLLQAIYQRDFPAIRAGMLAVSAFVVIVTVLIDLFARLIDPTQGAPRRGSL
ncbi:ABC transporter permease [Aestuariibacter sp. AA17]|uniref:ABC transporter permease n=1 Tax=Fluctibacter corallii TaxID=2984329 RepID=A0ABT3A3G9_9ALTE|nr:ABC transporter permease [Aestuariibacter sp. AA17]MCV2883157.1 ABC transporter permease [Aestuariibacter sp. AA17]